MTPRIRWLILAVALVGLAVAVASSWVHYQVLTDPSYVSPCDINATFNCTQVYLSRFGSVGGVPVALGGVVWFGLVSLVAGFAKPGKPSAAAGYLMALAIVGIWVVIYLGYASLFLLKTACVLCMATYACVIAILVLTASANSVAITRLPRRLFGDLRAALSRPVTLLAVLVYLGGTASVVAFFPREGSMAAHAAAAATARTSSPAAQQDFAAAWARQPRVDLGIPANGAAVIVVKFNDYECPACMATSIGYKPIFEKFQASHPGAVKLVLKDWPWSSACNFNIAESLPGHEASCAAAAAARMARDHNKYDEMEAWLYGHQDTTPDAVKEAAKTILGIADFDREYALKLPDIRRDIADGGVLQINSTPTFFINGVRLSQALPVDLFEKAIEIELNRK